MRIVSGKLKGRALATPSDLKVRPTSDRVREALFNILAHGIDDFSLEGAAVLDLFAGTGALGIEALSRDAERCIFVEHDPAARALIQENIANFGLGGRATVFRRSALDLGSANQPCSIGLVFADPPYGQGLGEQAIAAAITDNWLRDGAIIVIEEQAAATINWPASCEPIDQRTYGATQIAVARFLLAQ